MDSVTYKGEVLARRADGLLRKPKDCDTCILRTMGLTDEWGFTPDEIAEGAETFLWYQNPGPNEESGHRCVEPAGGRRWLTEPCTPAPMIGPTGYELSRTFLPLARLERGKNVSIGNTIRCRLIEGGQRTNNMPRGATWESAVRHCTQAHGPGLRAIRLVIAGGAHAWRALGGPGTVSEWRGYLKPDVGQDDGEGVRAHPAFVRWDGPVLATLHPADLGREPRMDLPTRRDYAKIPLILVGKWPKPIPAWRTCLTADDLPAMHDFFDEAEQQKWVVIDTEYPKDDPTRFCWMIGVGFEREGGTVAGAQLYRTKADAPVVSQFVQRLYRLVKHTEIVNQNMLADVPTLAMNFNITPDRYKMIHDTMQANTVLWSEWPDDLDFQASMFSDYPRTKHLFKTDPETYNWGDVIHTIEMWKEHLRQFAKDPAAWRIYLENLRILPIVQRSMESGLRVNVDKVKESIPAYRARMLEAEKVGQAWAGWPINLGSEQQQKVQLYIVEGLAPQKHAKSKHVTTNKDAVGELRKVYLGDIEGEQPTVEAMLENTEAGGHPFLEAMHLYNKAEHVLSAYLMPLVDDAKV